MERIDPMTKDKNDYAQTINKIAANTSVGIDPQLTHAIIIDYLQQITKRIENIEEAVKIKNK